MHNAVKSQNNRFHEESNPEPQVLLLHQERARPNPWPDSSLIKKKDKDEVAQDYSAQPKIYSAQERARPNPWPGKKALV